MKPTTRVVAGSQEDTSGSLAKANDMTGSGSGENAVLADDELLDAVGGTNLGNQLDHLRVPVSAIATNDEERTYRMDQIMAHVVCRTGGPGIAYPQLPREWTAGCW